MVKHFRHTGTGFNRVTGVLISRALTGIYPNMQLDYTQALVSKSRLPVAKNVKAVKDQTIPYNSRMLITALMVLPKPTIQQYWWRMRRPFIRLFLP